MPFNGTKFIERRVIVLLCCIIANVTAIDTLTNSFNSSANRNWFKRNFYRKSKYEVITYFMRETSISGLEDEIYEEQYVTNRVLYLINKWCGTLIKSCVILHRILYFILDLSLELNFSHVENFNRLISSTETHQM